MYAILLFKNMGTTENFKNDIQEYLEKRASEDALFAVSFAKKGKSINDCITYILNTVRQSGCNGFTDDEVYSMAVHYYDEDNIKIGKPVNCNVIVNHKVEAKPLNQRIKESMQPKKVRVKTKQELFDERQLSLF